MGNTRITLLEKVEEEFRDQVLLRNFDETYSRILIRR